MSFSKSAQEIYQVSLGISDVPVQKMKKKDNASVIKVHVKLMCKKCDQAFDNEDLLKIHSCLNIKQETYETIGNNEVYLHNHPKINRENSKVNDDPLQLKVNRCRYE